jgi:hypothetical protein
VIFRRRHKENGSTGAQQGQDEADQPAVEVDVATLDADVTGEAYRSVAGPWDVSERPVDTANPRNIDLGAIVVRGRLGFELRLQTDKETEAVQAVLLVAQDGAVELRAFAKPRGVGLWDDVRKEIAADAARRGGTATELDGRYGSELRVVAPIRTPEGQTATQTSRIVGVDGPRWLLRATFLGQPAQQPDPGHVLEAAVRDLVIVRGQEAMPPREQIPLRLPPAARRVEE